MKKTIFTLLLLSSFNLHAMGMNISAQDIYKHHSTAIDKVFICGEWSNGEIHGKYKVTHAYLYGQSFLYIEAISLDNDIGSYKVINTISIQEYNNDHAEVSLENLQCQALHNGIKLTATGDYGHEDLTRNIVINIKGSGDDYDLQESIPTQ